MSTDERITITVGQLAAALPDEQRLNVAKALIAAAYELCPKDRGGCRGEGAGPMSVELGNFLLDAINLLLHIPSETERRSQWWAAMRARLYCLH
jgi:hypothetical protein